MAKNKKRIVIISPYQFIERRGIERFVASLAVNLERFYGYDLIVYSWNAKAGNRSFFISSTIRVRKVPFCRYFQEKVAEFFYRFWLVIDRPDYILLNFLFHGEQSLPSRLKYLYILHYPASLLKHRYEFIRDKIEKFKNISFVAVSEMVKKEAVPYINGRKIDLIHNGVDLKIFNRNNRKESSAKRQLRIVTLAALEERKGIQFVIKALAKIKGKDFVYNVYGDGLYKQNLVSLIREMDLSNKVKINPSTERAAEVLTNSDIFCLLSKGEASPLALLEAMAAGCAVVVSQYSPFEEYVNAKRGCIVNREDSVSVVEAIDSLFDPNKRASLSLSGFEYVKKNFSWEKAVGQYYNILIEQDQTI
ncbi:MAG: glycosyltransferase family 4 protein [Candidatus Omnitrophica bacterium]|nr:glycosyltransferase family 4 protein [Candidatus Omnitrophota bacterium]